MNATSQPRPPRLHPPALVAVEAQRAAILHLIVRRPDMPAVMGPGVTELRGVLQAQGIDPTGPLFAHHLKMDGAVFDFELGFPVDHPVEATGRVRPGSLPAVTIARATYCGGYEGLPAAWGALRRWMSEYGHHPAADLWEVYVSGPETSQDPAEWRTELHQPVIRLPTDDAGDC